MSNIAIRAASADDLDRITEIYADAVTHGTASYELEPPGRAEMGNRFDSLAAGGFPYLVAEKDGVVLGYAYASAFRTRPAYRYLAEDSVYVSPDARGMGVGSTLLDALLSATASLGIRQMIAVIGGGSAASIAVHEKAGFKHVGRLPASGFKFGKWLDTVLMQIELGEGAETVPSEEPGITIAGQK